MAMRVTLSHPRTGMFQNGYVGFSWTFLFFGCLVPVFRGELLVGLIHCILSFITFGLWQLIYCWFYNKHFMKRRLMEGWVLDDNTATNQLAAQKLGIALKPLGGLI